MSPKMGRPKIENPKNKQIMVRLSTEEYKMLEENASYFCETKVESVRRGIREINKNIKK